MSKANQIKAVVTKTIEFADREGFTVKMINDGEEILFPTDRTTRTTMIEHATGTDGCRITFWHSDNDKDVFSVAFAFDNLPHEMIYDHSDSEVANAVCADVHDYFELRSHV